MPLPLLGAVLIVLVGAAASTVAATRAPHRAVHLVVGPLAAALVVAVAHLVGAGDRAGAAVVTFVLAVGLVVVVFADRALAVHPAGPRFPGRAAAVVGTAAATAAAQHVGVLLGAWVAAGAATVALVAVDASPGARRAARRVAGAFLVGDLALVAVGLAAWTAVGGSGDVERLADAVAGRGGALVVVVGLVVGLAVAARSAQLPFAGWLPATVAAPTVVSALLHAGVVNGSAVLLLRFHPVVAASVPVTVALVGLGTAGIVAGVAAARTRPDVKSGLAWTTVAQMGFMVVQATLGLVGPALVHLMGHGMFKSSLFLGASSALEHPGGARHPGGRPALRSVVAGSAVGLVGWVVALAVVRPPALEHPAAALPVVFGAATLVTATVRWFDRRTHLDVATVARATVATTAVGLLAAGVTALVEHGIAAPEVAVRADLVAGLALLVPAAALGAWAAAAWVSQRGGPTADALWFRAAVLADPVPARPDHPRR